MAYKDSQCIVCKAGKKNKTNCEVFNFYNLKTIVFVFISIGTADAVKCYNVRVYCNIM